MDEDTTQYMEKAVCTVFLYGATALGISPRGPHISNGVTFVFNLNQFVCVWLFLLFLENCLSIRHQVSLLSRQRGLTKVV